MKLKIISVPSIKWFLILVYLFFGQLLWAQTPVNFYKQFTGLMLTKTIRIELIKAPDRNNVGFNLRGSYYGNKLDDKVISLQGSLSKTGKVFLEEGYFKEDENRLGKPVFVKTANISGMYYPNRGRIEGKWSSANGKTTYNFNLQEDYTNGSIPAEIIFNDLEYEEAQIRFHYPKFKNHPYANQLNKVIGDSLLGDMAKQMHDFLGSYQDLRSTGGMIEGFDDSNICFINHNDNQILNLEYQKSSYTGGAHGINTNKYLNFNLKNGALLKFEDIFLKGSEKQLLQILESVLRASYNIPMHQSLGDFGFTLPNDRLYITKNFYINRLGIGFYYNVYEIAPYAVGSQDLFLPYSKIKHLIKKEAGLSKYF
jgi:hypothetical protein